MAEKIRVGLIGAGAGGSGWGARAHLGALKHLPGYTVSALCTSRRETAEAAAREHGVALAFHDARAMAEHPEVDLVAVAVRTPLHLGLVQAALAARKPVYCEWPFGRTVAEAEAMRDAAAAAGVVNMVGLQAQGSAALTHVRDLIAAGRIGRLLSATLVVSTPNWGASVHAGNAYLFDNDNGATALSIPGGHSVDALCYIAGSEFAAVKSVVAQLRDKAIVTETGAEIALTAPDQIAVAGQLGNGAVVSFQVKAGQRMPGTSLELNGTEGDVRIVCAGAAGIQYAQATVEISAGAPPAWQVLEIPARYRLVPAEVPEGPPLNVAQMYARLLPVLRDGGAAVPDFAYGVGRKRLLHRIIEGQAATA